MDGLSSYSLLNYGEAQEPAKTYTPAPMSSPSSSSSPVTSTTHTDANSNEHVLRPMDMTQIMNASLGLLLGSPGVFLAALVLANLPLLLWQVGALTAPDAWFIPPRYRSGQDLYGMLGLAGRIFTIGKIDVPSTIALMVSLLTSLLQSALIVPLVAAHYRGRTLSLLDALAVAQRALPRLLAAWALPFVTLLAAAWVYAQSNVAAVFGVVLLLVGFPCWLFLSQVVLLEDAAPGRAWQRSAALLRRRVVNIVGTWLIFELIFVVITALPTFVMGMSAALYPPGPRLNALTILAGNLAILLIEPLREAMATLLYFEQRRRRREKDA